MNDFVKIIRDLQRRLEELERQVVIRVLKIPTDGKLVVDSQSSDPTVENGRIYYNTSSNKLRKCTNGAWSDVG
jgi:hypothetical protein